MNKAVLFSTGKDNWETPHDFFAALYEEFRFTLDCAASANNTKCLRWLGPGSDLAENALGYTIPPGEVGYLNPPYSRGAQNRFLKWAALHGQAGITIVVLLPARTDTKRFHTYIWDSHLHKPHPWVREVRFLKGRIKFVGAEHGAPFPSMIVVFGTSD